MPQGFALSSIKATFSGTNSSKILLSVESLASEARLAQRMSQPIALGPGKLDLECGHQQEKIDLSYLGLVIQPRLATGSSTRG